MGIAETLKKEMGSLQELTKSAISKFVGTDPKLGQEVSSLVSPESGGLPSLVEQFKAKGLGNIIQSWVGTGPKLPISSQQIMDVLGSDRVRQMASRVGIDSSALCQKLAVILPQVVDHLTPSGKLPEAAPQPAGR